MKILYILLALCVLLSLHIAIKAGSAIGVICFSLLVLSCIVGCFYCRAVDYKNNEVVK